MICDAARATSAAWTYFPLTQIRQRYFADGGVEYNNPSFGIFDHYTVAANTSRIRNRYSHSANPMPLIPTHEGVDFSRVRILNIGTGSNIAGVTPPRERDRVASFIPDWILFGLFLKETLTKVATASERVADQMRTQERVRSGELLFDRLSASNGVCWIKLDRYLQLDEIARLTNEWLEDTDTKKYMKELAKDMATEYLQAHPPAQPRQLNPTSPEMVSEQPAHEQPANEQPTGEGQMNERPASENSASAPGSARVEVNREQGTEVPQVRVESPQDPASTINGSISPSNVEATSSTGQQGQRRPTWLSANSNSMCRSQSV